MRDKVRRRECESKSFERLMVVQIRRQREEIERGRWKERERHIDTHAEADEGK